VRPVPKGVALPLGGMLLCIVCVGLMVMFFWHVDISECVVSNTSGTGVALVSDEAVLREYSNACDSEWTEVPSRPPWIQDGTNTWIKQPPKGNVISNGTKGNMLSRKFLQHGRLVDPYPANSYDMQRNRAVEVVLIRIKDGPYRTLEGWMPIRYLRPTDVLP